MSTTNDKISSAFTHLIQKIIILFSDFISVRKYHHAKYGCRQTISNLPTPDI